LSLDEAENLKQIFSILSSSTRLRLLHAITQSGSPCVSELASALGMNPQAVSNQLRKMTDMGILRPRRHGKHIQYCLEHPGIKALLVLGLEVSRRTGR
jgi:DNA-binding transcriptional ArsR family regulator